MQCRLVREVAGIQAKPHSEVAFEYRSQRWKEVGMQILEVGPFGQRQQPAHRPLKQELVYPSSEENVLNLEFHAEPMLNTVLGQKKTMILHVPTLGKSFIHTRTYKNIYKIYMDE